MFIWPILLIAIILAIVWYVRGGSLSGVVQPAPRHSTGLKVLEERYARGKINRDEYLQKKRDLG